MIQHESQVLPRIFPYLARFRRDDALTPSRWVQPSLIGYPSVTLGTSHGLFRLGHMDPCHAFSLKLIFAGCIYYSAIFGGFSHSHIENDTVKKEIVVAYLDFSKS